MSGTPRGRGPGAGGGGARPEPPRAILWDVLGTLVYDPFYVEVPAFFGLGLEGLLAAKEPTAWARFEEGAIGEAELLRTFFLDRRPVDGEALKACMARAYRWIDGMPELLGELAARDVPGHALSNYSPWYRLIEERLGLSRYLDWSFVSCDTGVRKPDPEAFLGAARRLGLPPEGCLLVDDREENCLAARALGFPALRFEGAPRLREELEGLWGA